MSCIIIFLSNRFTRKPPLTAHTCTCNEIEQQQQKKQNKTTAKNNQGKKSGGGEDAKSKRYAKAIFADILHLEWVTKCWTCKQNVEQIWLIIARQCKNSLINFRRWFLAKWVNVYILLLLWLLTLVLFMLVTVHVVKKNQKQPKTLIASWVLHWLMFLKSSTFQVWACTHVEDKIFRSGITPISFSFPSPTSHSFLPNVFLGIF